MNDLCTRPIFGRVQRSFFRGTYEYVRAVCVLICVTINEHAVCACICMTINEHVAYALCSGEVPVTLYSVCI